MDLDQIFKSGDGKDVDFRAIYDLTIDKVFSYVLLRTQDRDWSKEIVQDIYLSLWKSLPKFEYISQAHFYGFLFTVVRRKLWKARIRFVKNVSLEDVYDFIEDESYEENKEDYRVLLKEISSLKNKERMVLELRYFSNFSFGEIGSALNISENNAKVLHHRAINKLRSRIPEYEI